MFDIFIKIFGVITVKKKSVKNELNIVILKVIIKLEWKNIKMV